MSTKGDLPLNHDAVWDPDDYRAPNVMGITLILAFIALVWFGFGFGVGYIVWA
jgi:hypothetical protein